MVDPRERFSSQVNPELLERMRPEFMGHFHASFEKNRRLGELLGKS